MPLFGSPDRLGNCPDVSDHHSHPQTAIPRSPPPRILHRRQQTSDATESARDHADPHTSETSFPVARQPPQKSQPTCPASNRNAESCHARHSESHGSARCFWAESPRSGLQIATTLQSQPHRRAETAAKTSAAAPDKRDTPPVDSKQHTPEPQTPGTPCGNCSSAIPFPAACAPVPQHLAHTRRQCPPWPRPTPDIATNHIRLAV